MAVVRQDLGNSKDGDSTTSLSNFFQYWITHAEKNLGRTSLTAIPLTLFSRQTQDLGADFFRGSSFLTEVYAQKSPNKEKSVLSSKNCTVWSFNKAQNITQGLASKQPQLSDSNEQRNQEQHMADLQLSKFWRECLPPRSSCQMSIKN